MTLVSEDGLRQPVNKKEAPVRSPAPVSETAIAVICVLAIIVHLALRFGGGQEATPFVDAPLYFALASSAPLVLRLLGRILRLEMTADLLAGVSIIAAIALGEYLAGTIVVLLMSSGQLLEALAIRRASFAVDALAKRLPLIAHLKDGTDKPISEVQVGDEVVVHPHEICPVDGIVTDGRSTMNEAYLTGEPYVVPKAIGSGVLSGAVNGVGLLTVRRNNSR